MKSIKGTFAPPNYGSPKATTASLKIDLWYHELKVWERWTWGRFVRLSQFLNRTAEELASVVGIPHSRLASFERTNHLMNTFNTPDRSATLLLTVLEAHFCKHLTKDVIENPFPNLAKL